MILLCPEFIRQPGSVNHRLLRLLLAVLGLVQHVVNLRLHGVHITLEAALLRASTCVDTCHFVYSITSLAELSLSLLLAALGRVEQGARLLHLAGQRVASTLDKAVLLVHFLALLGGFGHSALSLAFLGLKMKGIALILSSDFFV